MPNEISGYDVELIKYIYDEKGRIVEKTTFRCYKDAFQIGRCGEDIVPDRISFKTKYDHRKNGGVIMDYYSGNGDKIGFFIQLNEADSLPRNIYNSNVNDYPNDTIRTSVEKVVLNNDNVYSKKLVYKNKYSTMVKYYNKDKLIKKIDLYDENGELEYSKSANFSSSATQGYLDEINPKLNHNFESQHSSAFSGNNKGKLLEVFTDGEKTSEFSYDDFGNVVGRKTTNNSYEIEYKYDEKNNWTHQLLKLTDFTINPPSQDYFIVKRIITYYE